MIAHPIRAAVLALSLVGIAIAGYLTYSRYADVSLACATGGCETVQSSRYSEVVGVPVAVLGLLGYAGILAATIWDTVVARAAAFALATIGFAFGLYLLYVQLFVLEAICHWCLASDAVMTALFVVTLLRVRADYLEEAGAA